MKILNQNERFSVSGKYIPNQGLLSLIAVLIIAVFPVIGWMSNRMELMLIPFILLLLMMVIVKYGLNYRITLVNRSFSIQKTVLGVRYFGLGLNYDTYNYSEKNWNIELRRKNQDKRIMIACTVDLEWDYLEITDENGKSIVISSNEDAEALFKLLVAKIELQSH